MQRSISTVRDAVALAAVLTEGHGGVGPNVKELVPENLQPRIHPICGDPPTIGIACVMAPRQAGVADGDVAVGTVGEDETHVGEHAGVNGHAVDRDTLALAYDDDAFMHTRRLQDGGAGLGSSCSARGLIGFTSTASKPLARKCSCCAGSACAVSRIAQAEPSRTLRRPPRVGSRVVLRVFLRRKASAPRAAAASR